MYKKTHVFALYYIIIIIKFVTNIYNDTDKQYIYNKLQDNTRDWNVEQLPKHILDIENNTWCAEIPDLFRVLNMISCSTREINLVFPSTHVFFCLLYKQNSVKNNKTSVAMRFTTNDIFTRKNIVFFTCV